MADTGPLPPPDAGDDPHLTERRLGGTTLVSGGFLELRRDDVLLPDGNHAKVLLEWPAGKRDPGESTLACAMRELQEETGYTACEWAYGGEIHNAAAYSSESIWIWFARGLVAGPPRLDHGEFVETVTLTEAELAAIDLHDGLPDVKTLIGLHWLQQWHSGRRPLTWHSAQHGAAL